MNQTPTTPRALPLLALGVVFGDIGTSPLYAFRAALAVAPDMAEPANVLGILSLIVWSLIVLVGVKYCAVILNADNRGEGGVLALSTLVLAGRLPVGRAAVGLLGMAGAALFFADGALTPAISVLSAVEGVTVGHAGAAPWVLPATLAIILVLFRLQSGGTARIGGLFGPVMLVWFASLAVMGVAAIARAPRVLLALDPRWAMGFLGSHGGTSLAVLGAVFLAVTGGEALYADLGHFGRTAIRQAWYGVAFPALALNYLGQGALVLATPATRENPFFLMVPTLLLAPLVLLATAATVIASQAVISGAFSVVRQAVRLSYLPRMAVEHSSATTIGQVFVPAANIGLGLLTATLVVAFGSSAALASAYGIAVAAVTVISTVLTMVWLAQRDSTGHRLTLALMAVILVADVGFCVANLLKFADGGWVPVALAVALFIVMNTWTRGRVIVAASIAREHRSVSELKALLAAATPPVRVPGTAVYLASNAEGLPRALWHNVRLNNVLHQHVLLVTIETEEVPRVGRDRRISISEVLPGMTRIVARYGFMESPQVTHVLYEAEKDGLRFDATQAIYFVGTESMFYGRTTLRAWEKRLFAFLMRNARRAASFYGVPDARLVEFGTPLRV